MDSLSRLALTPLLLAIHAVYLLVEQIPSTSTLSTTLPSSPRRPKHVAFSLVTSESSRRPHEDVLGTRTRTLKGKEKAQWIEDEVDVPRWTEDGLVQPQWTEDELFLLETVKSAIAWAMKNDVDEISLWNEHGILQTILPGLLDILVPYTPTSPDPGSSSPASTSSSTSTSSTPNLERQSYTVWPDLTQLITKPTRSNPLSVHVLPRTASDEVLRRITSGLVGSDTPVEEITVDLVDGLVRGSLGFQSDPQLLIVHRVPRSTSRHYQPTNHHPNLNDDADEDENHPNSHPTWRHRALSSFFPRPALELHGYPFWMLRITEIYHSGHERVGIRQERDRDHQGSMDATATLGWDLALERWVGVEQRLGR